MPSAPRCCDSSAVRRLWILIPAFCSFGLVVGNSACPIMTSISLLPKVSDARGVSIRETIQAGFRSGPGLPGELALYLRPALPDFHDGLYLGLLRLGCGP